MGKWQTDSSGKELFTKDNPANVAGSASDAVLVTPNDATVITATKGIYVGVAGDVVVVMASGNEVKFVGLSAGMIHPISATKIKSTGTTATNIVAVY